MHCNSQKGFTLVELLIIVTIVGILSSVVIFFINPDELLKQTRDSNRVTDLGNINRAISFYLTQSTDGDLNGTANNADCDAVYYVFATPTNNSFVGKIPSPSPSQRVNGTGWLPIDFTQTLAGASPLSIIPIDPTNTGDLIYRYACKMTGGAREYELNAKFESQKYTNAAQLDRDSKDGGDRNNDAAPLGGSFYEVGNKLDL